MRGILQRLFLWLFGLFMLGCGPIRVELLPPALPDPNVIIWQQKITDEINQHELRLRELEKEKENANGPI